jgi:hypothetical protein
MASRSIPPVAQAILDGTRLGNLDAAERQTVVDALIPHMRDIAASLAHIELRKHPMDANDKWARANAYGLAHDAVDRMMVDWFKDQGQPTFEQSKRAIETILLRPDPATGHQALRFPRMLTERRRALGIPDDFLKQPADLNFLAKMIDIPPGLLLKELRVDSGLMGSKRVALVIPEFMRVRVHEFLYSIGLDPWIPETEPTLFADSEPATAPVQPPRAASPKAAGLDPKTQSALDLVLRIQAAQTQIGSIDQFFEVFGGRERFNEVFGFKTIQGQQRPEFAWNTMQDYLKRRFDTKTPSQLARDKRLPGAKQQARIERLLNLIEPNLPADGAACTASQRRTLGVAVQAQLGAQPSLFDNPDKANPSGPAGAGK